MVQIVPKFAQRNVKIVRIQTVCVHLLQRISLQTSHKVFYSTKCIVHISKFYVDSLKIPVFISILLKCFNIYFLAHPKSLVVGATVGGIIALLIGVGLVVLAIWYKYILILNIG